MIQIARAVDALNVHSYTSYTWCGERIEAASPLTRAASLSSQRRALAQELSRRLYDDFFTVGAPHPRSVRPSQSRRRLVPALTSANLGEGCFDGGWSYVGRDADQYVVERNGLRLWVEPEDLRATTLRDGLAVGALVEIRWGKDAFISPGYYMALSNTSLTPPRPQLIDRYYFHVRPETSAALMRRVTRVLNDAGLAFRFKIVDDPADFERCDTAVLAVQRRDRESARPLVVGIHRATIDDLNDETPALTHRLGHGFAFAEDPDNHLSFGAHRCELIAEGIVDAFDHDPLIDSGRRLDFVRKRFVYAGVSFEEPYLHCRGSESGTQPIPPRRRGA